MSVPDSEFAIPVDSVIAAVSQEPDIEGLEALMAAGRLEAESGADGQNVLAGGDALALGIAAQAIVQGRLAAEALHARLQDTVPPASPVTSRPAAAADVLLLDYYPSRPAAHRPHLAPGERLAAPTAEVTAGLNETAFLAEASRCLSCGSCFGCQQCAMYCTSGGFLKLDHAQPGQYYTLTLDHCEECGKCISVCPCGYLEAAPGAGSNEPA
jgi:Pyruvate/2-oxoacid:ferredoxin oxidoreductase delta subunit